MDNTLYNWLFHYNTHTETWTAFHREDHNAYWNKSKFLHPYYTAKDFDELIEIIYTTCT